MSGSFREGEYSKMGYCVNPIHSLNEPPPQQATGYLKEDASPSRSLSLRPAQGRRTQHDPFDPSTGSGSSRGRSRGDKTQGHGEENRTMTNQWHS